MTRVHAQNRYALLRTFEPLPGVMGVKLYLDFNLGVLIPTMPVRAIALAP